MLVLYTPDTNQPLEVETNMLLWNEDDNDDNTDEVLSRQIDEDITAVLND
jgi:hypothetical protein